MAADPPSVAARRALTDRLHGHTTSERWLPEGLWPELDKVRDDQLRLCGQVAANIAALDQLAERFKAEDDEHAEQLRQAHPDGAPASAEDRRTPPDQRASKRAVIEEVLWAGVHRVRRAG